MNDTVTDAVNGQVEDPRLRLLGSHTAGSAQSPAAEVLRRLDGTEVVVALAPDAAGAARVAVAAFVTMIARLVPRVVVDDPAGNGDLPTNWWQAASSADLLDKLAPVRPVTDLPVTRRITVGFGVTEPVCDIYVGGGDWNVVLADSPIVMEAGNDHGLGLHAAACLAISQVLIKVLGDLGFPGVEVTGVIETNLIDHRLRPVDENDLASATHLPPAATVEVARTGFLGVGSVGTSALALLATACSPILNPSAAAAAMAAVLEVTAVDKDVFDPGRNPYRYPALLGGETGKKSIGMVERLKQFGLTAEAHGTDVATWNTTKDEPGWHGVTVSSVDTLSGRLDVADVLSEETLSAGVSGTELHVQWERFADGFACPFCDFVRADPPLTQAGVYSQVTGISVAGACPAPERSGPGGVRRRHGNRSRARTHAPTRRPRRRPAERPDPSGVRRGRDATAGSRRCRRSRQRRHCRRVSAGVLVRRHACRRRAGQAHAGIAHDEPAGRP